MVFNNNINKNKMCEHLHFNNKDQIKKLLIILAPSVLKKKIKVAANHYYSHHLNPMTGNLSLNCVHSKLNNLINNNIMKS